jgi:hypothetical protein
MNILTNPYISSSPSERRTRVTGDFGSISGWERTPKEWRRASWALWRSCLSWVTLQLFRSHCRTRNQQDLLALHWMLSNVLSFNGIVKSGSRRSNFDGIGGWNLRANSENRLFWMKFGAYKMQYIYIVAHNISSGIWNRLINKIKPWRAADTLQKFLPFAFGT